MAYKEFKFKPVTIDGLTFKDVQYHRNGVAGDGFHCAVINDPESDGDMLITYFDIPRHCCCAVYKLDLLPDITFGVNSWRGDRYAYPMSEAIKAYEKQFDKHYGIKR